MRRISVLTAAVLALGLVPPTSAAQAAPTRYEAESAPAICDGTIDSNWPGFSGTGFCNGANAVGAAAQFTVNAANTGTATIAIRYANGASADRSADIIVNGSPVQPASSFAPTGAWSTWATKTLTAQVNSGSNTIRLSPTTAGGLASIDFLDFEVTPPQTFADYQAENCTISQGVVESNHAGFTGTGLVNMDNAAGSYIQCTVSSTAAGTFSVEIRFANGTTTDRPMTITANGTGAQSVSFPGTGAWSTWSTQTRNVSLNAGSNTIRMTATTANGGPNVDRIRVAAPVDTQRPTAPGQPSCSNIGETTMTLNWGPSSDNVGVVAYDIFHLGTQIATAPAPPAPPYNLTGLQPNFQYQISVFARDAAGNVSDTSPEVLCRTQAISDPTPPTTPTNLTHSNITQTTVNLSWGASSDNRGVTAYEVLNASNAVIHTVTGNPPATSTTVPGLTCNTAHTVRVRAKDAAGNVSGTSNAVSFTTATCSRGVPQTPTTIAGGWDVPWDISWYPNGSAALVTERDTFRVFRVLPNGTKTQLGTVPNSVSSGGEGGLMGVAMSPTWNGTTDTDVFFMHTSNDGGTTQNRIVRMSYNGTTLSNRTVIFGGIRYNRYHNGGRLKFGPDGYLYVTTGDAQQTNTSPDLNSLNGKILRITKTGAAAPGNPFNTAVYSYGHRNPQGLAWDSAGRLWSSELGNSSADELNLILPGRNYGWPTCEGTCNVSGMENPKMTFSVSTASPSGIAIVNDTVYVAAMRGQRLWRIELSGTSAGAASTYFVSTYGRLRAVEKIPGANAIWFGTTNSDALGSGAADVIRRSNIQ
ncbi:PQQ-dependent sugar dehydrogenase [Allorhizocola rhizosphaerae]|uniref:PQQ-dependent sugar dehydrogenase n=1 Tax=Allorhizocola rhizosphaerae TaxID=1872709 RepID=UPI000E3C2C9C|nr:PQQ-dependent sugar dehydrogenase [Allorhizocola rhizosphaerae]